MKPRRLFIAGSTGATGRTVVRLARAQGVSIVAHQRPHPGRAAPPDAAVFELSDHAALTKALEGCTTVVQLIGTMRKRFASGDTYETSDIGTTQQLVDAAKRAGSIDHLVLLSSVGAGRPVGAYLKAKAVAERLVVESGIPYTILRPSTFVGEGHTAPPGLGLVTSLPGLRKYQPIAVEQLCRTILRVAVERTHLGEALEGESLWKTVRE